MAEFGVKQVVGEHEGVVVRRLLPALATVQASGPHGRAAGLHEAAPLCRRDQKELVVLHVAGDPGLDVLAL
ncbi:MAG: hypothetical protein ACOC0J_01525 [Myxococcota bacterium]